MDVVQVIRLLAVVLWGVSAFLFLRWIGALVRTKGRPRPAAWPFVATLVGAVLATTLAAGIIFIPPQERGVVISALTDKGYRERPLDDSIEARTKDGQRIFIDASVIYAIDPERVIEVHLAWQDRYAEDLVRPLVRGIIRDAVSQFRVDEVVSSRRFELQQYIYNELKKRLAENGLVLYDFVLRDVNFTPEYAQAVEQKQIAEQQAQQAKFLVEKKRQEAEQLRQIAQGEADARLIRARAEAEALLIQAEAQAKALALVAEVLQNNPELLTYEYIQKLAPGIQVMLVPTDNPFLLPLPTLTPGTIPVPTPTPTPTPTPAP